MLRHLPVCSGDREERGRGERRRRRGEGEERRRRRRRRKRRREEDCSRLRRASGGPAADGPCENRKTEGARRRRGKGREKKERGEEEEEKEEEEKRRKRKREGEKEGERKKEKKKKKMEEERRIGDRRGLLAVVGSSAENRGGSEGCSGGFAGSGDVTRGERGEEGERERRRREEARCGLQGGEKEEEKEREEEEEKKRREGRARFSGWVFRVCTHDNNNKKKQHNKGTAATRKKKKGWSKFLTGSRSKPGSSRGRYGRFPGLLLGSTASRGRRQTRTTYGELQSRPQTQQFSQV